MKRENLTRTLILLACLLFVTLMGHTEGKQTTDFIFASQNDVPVWIRWSDVAMVKLYDDNGGPESYWEITVKGASETPVVIKDAYSFPWIAERLKDKR